MLGLAHEPAPGVGVGVGAVIVGLVLILLGIAYLTDYKRIASRARQGDITGWQSAPKVLARYFAPRVAKTPVWHYRIFGRIFGGVTFVTFGVVGVGLGIASLALRS